MQANTPHQDSENESTGLPHIETLRPPVTPAPVQMGENPAQLAMDSANSAVNIAHAVAALGMPGEDDQKNANLLWQETINQIERVQKLHGLPAMPFQSNAGKSPSAMEPQET
jgi:hypothetical protein